MKSKLLCLILLFLSFISINILAYNEPALEIIANQIVQHLINEKDTSLLNKVTDDLVVQPELQEIVRKKLISIFMKNLSLQPELYKELEGHKGAINSVAFSPDGRYILTGSDDKTARLWDITKNPIEEPIKLAGHKYGINSVAFSPDSRYVLTGSDDNAAWLWDITKNPIKSIELVGHKDTIRSVVFSPDGRYVLTGSDDGTARVWILNPLLKIIDKLNIPLLVDINKLQESVPSKELYESLINNLQS